MEVDETNEFEIISSDSQGMVIRVRTSGLEVSTFTRDDGLYQLFNLTGVDLTQNPGEPRLPIIGKLIGLPVDAQLSLEILNDHIIDLPGPFRILPASIPIAVDELSPGELISPIRNEDYQKTTLSIPGKNEFSDKKPGAAGISQFFPYSVVQLGEEAWLRDQRIMRIAFYPIQYQESTGKAIWHQDVTFKISFNYPFGTSRISSVNGSENPFEDVLAAQLINYEQARNWRNLPIIQGNHEQNVDKLNHSSSLQARFRIGIKQDGIYRLTYENLAAAGVPIHLVNSTSLRMTSQGREVGYFIVDGNQNQVFEPGDSVMFYGQKFYGDWMANRYINENRYWLNYSIQLPNGSSSSWKPVLNATMLEKYTDENVYWLEFSNLSSLEESSNIATKASYFGAQIVSRYIPRIQYHSIQTSNAQVSSYKATVHVEQDNVWKTTLFAGEDTWYWEEIKVTTDTPVKKTYVIPTSNPASGGYQAKLRGEIIAAAYNDSKTPDHHIKIYLNDNQESQVIYEKTWDGKSRLTFEVSFDQAKLIDGDNQLDVVFIRTPYITVDDLFINWFEIEYNREFMAENNRVSFTSDQSGIKDYQISGFTSDEIFVFNTTDPVSPQNVEDFTYSAGTVQFQIDQPAGEQYEVSAPIDIASNSIQSKPVVNFNQPADYLIISHADLLSGAQALANYRSAQGLITRVINVADLYNEFNDGIYNPIAIKNFLAYAFNYWTIPPSYVVLVGDGHWNFKASPSYDYPPIYMPPNLAWVDPWQGEVDSANLLATIVGNDPLPDLHISRIPANSNQQLLDILAKIQTYEQNPPQKLKNNYLFITDNTPDPAGDFVLSSDQIISQYIPASSNRVYLDSFTDTNNCGTPNGSRTCPAATEAILNAFNQDSVMFVNYAGHGALNYWAGEQIFANQDIPLIQNGGRTPIFLSMTCLDGYWIHPNLSVASKSGPALAEELLRTPINGAVATFSPTGLGVATGHDALQRGFYDSIYKSNQRLLGEAALSAKLRLYSLGYSQDLLHTFIIFGDPALEMTAVFDMFLPKLYKQ